VFPLIEGRGFGWPLWAFAMMAAAAVGFALLLLHLRRRAQQNRSQLLPLHLLANGNFLLGAGVTTIFFTGVPGFFTVLAIFLQSGFGYSPLQSGLATLPFPLGTLVTSFVSGRLGSRFPRLRLSGGALAMVVGMGWLGLVISGMGDTVDHWGFVLPLFLAGIGLNTALSALFQTVLAGVPHRDAGSASGALQSFQQIGGALGVAIVGEIFFSSIAAHMAAGGLQHPAYVSGMQGVLLYEMAAFGLFAVLVYFLKAPAHSDGPQQAGARPVEVHAGE